MESKQSIAATVQVTIVFPITVDVPGSFWSLVGDYFHDRDKNDYCRFLADALVDHLVDDGVKEKLGTELFSAAEVDYVDLKLIEPEE